MKKVIAILICCLLMTACTSRESEATSVPTQPTSLPASAPTGTTAPTVSETAPTVPETTPTVPETVPTVSTTAPAETEPPVESTVVKFTIYTPNENADGFYATDIVIEHLDAAAVLQELIKENVLTDAVSVNAASVDGTQLNLDFNAAFRDLIFTMGSAGERMLMGSVVNTYLSAYDAETVYITIDGEILESGHVVYDFPMEYFE